MSRHVGHYSTEIEKKGKIDLKRFRVHANPLCLFGTTECLNLQNTHEIINGGRSLEFTVKISIGEKHRKLLRNYGNNSGI